MLVCLVVLVVHCGNLFCFNFVDSVFLCCYVCLGCVGVYYDSLYTARGQIFYEVCVCDSLVCFIVFWSCVEAVFKL